MAVDEQGSAPNAAGQVEAGTPEVPVIQAQSPPIAAKTAVPLAATALSAAIGPGHGSVDESVQAFEHPIYKTLLNVPGLSVAVASLDQLLTWGQKSALFMFPMATSCCGIEFMATAASRVDVDRMGAIVRGTPRQADVMVIAGTITVKMAPKVKRLWEQMPEPKWAVAMGSCAISGDFYRDLYPTIPGIDTVLPVDVYVPGCPPDPQSLMHGLMRLQEKIGLKRAGQWVPTEVRPETEKMTNPGVRRLIDPQRDPEVTAQQTRLALAATVDEPEGELLESGAEAVEQQLRQDLQTLLRERFEVEVFPADAAPIVARKHHLHLARTLKAMGYLNFVYVVASHWPSKDGETFEVAYAVRRTGPGTTLAQWRVQLAADEPIESLAEVWAGADWQEREQYDLVGVQFAGHPDLRRLMLSDDWQGHPLRRDYPADKACFPWR